MVCHKHQPVITTTYPTTTGESRERLRWAIAEGHEKLSRGALDVPAVDNALPGELHSTEVEQASDQLEAKLAQARDLRARLTEVLSIA